MTTVAQIWRLLTGVLGLVAFAFLGGLAWGACVVGARLVERLVH
jgi:hypothetical protein